LAARSKLCPQGTHPRSVPGKTSSAAPPLQAKDRTKQTDHVSAPQRSWSKELKMKRRRIEGRAPWSMRRPSCWTASSAAAPIARRRGRREQGAREIGGRGRDPRNWKAASSSWWWSVGADGRSCICSSVTAQQAAVCLGDGLLVALCERRRRGKRTSHFFFCSEAYVTLLNFHFDSEWESQRTQEIKSQCA
jgi:hypothetical protein